MTKDDVKIKIIRIGEPEIPFEYFDEPVIPLTEEQESAIKESVKKAFKEMTDFMEDSDK